MDDSIDRFFAQWKARNMHLSRQVQYIYRIARISKILGRRLDATCAKHGLTRSQFEALAALRRMHPTPLSAQQVMDASLLTSGSVTAMINQLLVAGLVERDVATDDRRRIQIRLTRDGMRAIDVAIRERVDDNTQLAKLLPVKDQDAINGLLRRLLSAMEALEESGQA